MKTLAPHPLVLVAAIGMHAVFSCALPNVESTLFSGSGNCAFCHEQWSGALLDSAGNNVSITGDWRSTMMAHSFADPLWRARMEAEIADHPELKTYIEDKCLTCHAPMARTQHRFDEGVPLSMDTALDMELAHDGVSCSLCHQIQAENLGEDTSLDGGYMIGGERLIFGPYTNVVTMPMRNHVNYTPEFGKHVQESGMCATCHTLFTPILNEKGEATGEFPEQVPYLEWLNSSYPEENRHCQDCHMPRLDEPIQITARPPWIGRREPFWRHTFPGANTFMMQLQADPGNELCSPADASSLAQQLEAARRFLRKDTAVLSVAPEWNGNELLLGVKVENRAGHKFPTGYPYRRAWLRVEVKDVEGKSLFLSGGFDADGRLKGQNTGGYAPHQEEITSADQVQVYQAVMGDVGKRPTTYLLRATHYLKDNRIPPKGFRKDGPHNERTAVRGAAAADRDYTSRNGCDVTLYRVPIPEGTQRLWVGVDLLYQPVPPESVDTLIESALPAAKEFARRYDQADKKPEMVQSVAFTLDPFN